MTDDLRLDIYDVFLEDDNYGWESGLSNLYQIIKTLESLLSKWNYQGEESFEDPIYLEFDQLLYDMSFEVGSRKKRKFMELVKERTSNDGDGLVKELEETLKIFETLVSRGDQPARAVRVLRDFAVLLREPSGLDNSDRDARNRQKTFGRKAVKYPFNVNFLDMLHKHGWDVFLKNLGKALVYIHNWDLPDAVFNQTMEDIYTIGFNSGDTDTLIVYMELYDGESKRADKKNAEKMLVSIDNFCKFMKKGEYPSAEEALTQFVVHARYWYNGRL